MTDWITPRTSQELPHVSKDVIEIEVKSNLEYLKDAVDDNLTTLSAEVDTVETKLDDCVMRDGSTVTYASPSGTRAKTTVYQNTSGKIRMVTICAYGAAVGDEMVFHVGSTSTPTIHIGDITGIDDTGSGNITFFVPPNYYYEAKETTATMTIAMWIEWDLL